MTVRYILHTQKYSRNAHSAPLSKVTVAEDKYFSAVNPGASG